MKVTTCPSKTIERNRLLSWQQQHELAAVSGGKSPGSEVPDRVLLKAVEYLESKTKG